MTVIPPAPPSDFTLVPADPFQEMARSFRERGQQQVDSAVAKAREDFLARMDEQMKKLESELKDKLVTNFRTAAISLIAVFVAAFSLFVWAQAKSAQETMTTYQSSVLGLQREIMASQTTINKATSELAQKNAELEAARTEIDAARKRLDQTSAEYTSLISTVRNTRR